MALELGSGQRAKLIIPVTRFVTSTFGFNAVNGSAEGFNSPRFSLTWGGYWLEETYGITYGTVYFIHTKLYGVSVP